MKTSIRNHHPHGCGCEPQGRVYVVFLILVFKFIPPVRVRATGELVIIAGLRSSAATFWKVVPGSVDSGDVQVHAVTLLP